MKTILLRLSTAILVSLFSIRLTNFWEDYPDLFPAPLRWLGLQFVGLFERRTPEEIADLEQLFVLFVSLMLVSLIAWLVLVVLKRWMSKSSA